MAWNVWMTTRAVKEEVPKPAAAQEA